MSLALSEHLPLIALAPDGIQKLRSLILELAIRGKLLQQDLSKTLEPSIQISSDSELATPFPISRNWSWVPLKATGRIFNGNSINSSEKASKFMRSDGLPYIATKDVGYGLGELDYNNGVRIPEGEPKFRLAKKGTVFICAEGGSAGKKCGLTDQDVYFGNKLYALEPHKCVDSKYVLYVYMTETFRVEFEKSMTGIIGGISSSKFGGLPFPLPPLDEQLRIVAKVDELMTLCDRLETEQSDAATAHARLIATLLGTLTQSTNAADFETNWKRIAEHFDTLFTTEASVDALKQTILQLAVMGKLVPQVSTDEPVAALLMRLANSSEKTKSIPEVSVEEHPFAIPDSWAWGRVASLGKTQTGTTPSKSQPTLFGTDYPFIKPGDISVAGSINYDNEGLSSQGATASGRLADPNSILMVCIGTIGKCGQIDRPCSFNQQINSVTPIEGTSDFALVALQSPYFQSEAWNKSSSTTLSILNKGKWESIPVPLPPLAEQHRIVAKVDLLLELCESLKAELAMSGQQASCLAEALVKSHLS